jgi:hypothetical protein
VQVAFQQLALFQRRILAVHAAFYHIADDEGNAAGAVVGAGAVVMDPAAKLGKDQQQHVIGGVMLLQVLVEIGDGVGGVPPQLGMGRQLSGMSVEAVVRGGGVQNSGPKAGQMHLSDVLHVLSHYIAAVLYAGRILLRSGAENVGALQSVHTRLRQVVYDGVAAQGGGVDAGENVQGVSPLVFAVNAGQHAIGSQVAH